MRTIPRKNYIILFFTFVSVVLVTIYINNSIKYYQYFMNETSPLKTSIAQINSNALNEALGEINEGILYVGSSGDKEIRKLEISLYKKIKNEDIKDYIYYYDNINNDDLNKLNSFFKEKNITKEPALIYFKSKEIIEYIDSTEELICVEDLKYLIDKYEIGK